MGVKKGKYIKAILTLVLLIVLSITTVYADNETSDENTTTGNQTETETNTNTETETNTTTETTTTSEESQQNETPSQNAEEQPTVQETENVPQVVEEEQHVVQPKQTTSSVKSSNANLSNLGITPNDFSGFRENITSYTVTVPNTIKEVSVYATAKDSSATVTGTGKIQLKDGVNTAKVVVTAADGTTKTYTITIKKLKQGEEIDTSVNSGLRLETLKIEGFDLEPAFDKDKFQYTVRIEGSLENLNITAEPNSETANVKILGNEKLMNGQNIITILLSDDTEEGIVTYQIYANKNLVEQSELNQHIKDAETSYRIKQVVIIVLIVIIVAGIITLLILVHKKNNDPDFKKEKVENKKSKNKRKGKHS